MQPAHSDVTIGPTRARGNKLKNV